MTATPQPTGNGADRSAGAGRPRRSRETGARQAIGRLGSRWRDERELAHAIYGTVVGSAVMVAASLHGALGQVVISVVVTLLVYWVAERYAELLAAGARGSVPDRQAVIVALHHGWPMLQASYLPLVVLLVASALGAELPTAVLAALCLSTVLLANLGYGAARRSDASLLSALGWAAASAMLGVAVILLKLALH